MAVLLPTCLDDALIAIEREPKLTVLAGGTDLMVPANAGRLDVPAGVMSLRRVKELKGWRVEEGRIRIGAAVTHAELCGSELADLAPALAQAARTVGSPQIRNTGTIGGNIATASPAGDTLPVLAALDAEIELVSVRDRRRLPIHDFITGPKRNALACDELIAAVDIPVAAGPQEFLKIGVRNAMVISVAGCAVVVDLAAHHIACALGSVGPVPIRDRAAEAWLAKQVDWSTGQLRNAQDAVEFGNRMAAAALPIDDHRSTAAYRRHAVSVLARRAVGRSLL